MDSKGSEHAFSGAGLIVPVRPTAPKEQQGKRDDFDRLNPAPEHEVAGEDGLSHHGEPEVEVIEEAEVEVVEEPPSPEDHRRGPKIVRAPRAPTQKEIDAHMATHLPHEPWCEICMQGRGRNSPHKRNPQRWARRRQRSPEEANPEGEAEEEEEGPECGDTEGSGTASGAEPDGQLHDGPVPRVSMDYFYLSKRGPGGGTGGQALSTKELQKKLKEIGKSSKGSRSELIKRCDREAQSEEAENGHGEKAYHRRSLQSHMRRRTL